ncbi:MAG: PAS domain S-box protein [Methanoregula sp.]
MVLTISVLYVDDEPGLLEIGKNFLEQTPEFAVTTAQSASAGLIRLKSNGIQAIVSDYQMPEMDGIEFLKKVRATNKTIPFILFTGRGREEIAIEAFENGADFYLQKGGAIKPQFAELMHKIRIAVDHRKDEAEVATLNRLYTVLSATNKAIVHIHNKKELLNEICQIVIHDGGFRMAWAGLVNHDKHVIEPTATSGHVESYLDNITISTDNIPQGQGPTGSAFRKKIFNVCNDIENAPKMMSWRKGALERGYRSLAAFPFAPDTGNAGVITYFASEKGFFTDQIIRLLEEQAGDISFALVNLDHEEREKTAEAELKKSELKYRRLFETAQDAILILDGENGEIIDANKFILDMLGYPLAYFIGKHLWELGFLKDKSFAQHAFTELKSNGYIRYEDIPLETKDGMKFNVEFISNVYYVDNKKIIQCNIRDITDKKVVQDALQASETRYRRLFETAQDGILILDWDSGEIIDANKFILDMLGYPLEDFIGKHLWELGFLKDKAFAKTAFAKLKTEGYIRYEDLPLETKQGNVKKVEFISNVYPEGKKRIIQCNIRDITERKLAEEERARLAAIMEYSEDAIIGKSLDGFITRWNAGAERIYGYSAQEMVGKSISLLVPPDLPDDTPGIIERIRYGEPVIRYETLRRKKDGGLINVTLTASQIKDTQNRLIGVSTISHDITKRKMTEEAMQVSETRYRRLFESAQDAILILDGDTGEIIDANTFILDMLGYPLEDFIGRHLWELGFLKDKAFAQTAFEKLKTEGYIRYEDLPLETKQGKSMSVEFISNVYLVGNKRIIQCNIRDITDRKRAQDALALASRKLALLSGITRHDIVNQLMVLSGSLERAQDPVKEPDRIAHISRAQKAADTIQRQIAFTKEYEDLGVMTPVWQRLSEIVRSAASQMAANTINIEPPEKTLEIYADPLLIKVFFNLFENTRQYGGTVTRISISHHPVGNGVIITVTDDGIGISSEDKKHLFERGYGKHTGLGLFLSREILSITGISIRETSEPGHGARFEITVPEGAFRFMEEPSPSRGSSSSPRDITPVSQPPSLA